MLIAATLTLSLVTVSYGGTITGGRTSATGSRAGVITGSRTGLITGSRAGTITGGRISTSPNSRTTLSAVQDEFLPRIITLLVSVSW
jgi:hypothetical protein